MLQKPKPGGGSIPTDTRLINHPVDIVEFQNFNELKSHVKAQMKADEGKNDHPEFRLFYENYVLKFEQTELLSFLELGDVGRT